MFLINIIWFLSVRELRQLQFLVIFIVKIYIKYWFECNVPTLAAKNDLQLIKNLLEFKSEVNSAIAEDVIKTMSRHMWYLSETLIGMAFFDRTINFDIKKLMVLGLQNQGHVENPRRININLSLVPTQNLNDFVTKNTIIFFDTLFANSVSKISKDFLSIDPEQWYSNDNYLKAEEIVKNLLITNDVAERAVALAKDFNESFTRNEDEKQMVFQLVEKHRNEFPLPKKKIIIEKLQV